MGGCSWWWAALVFIGGMGVGQIALMASLAMLAGGSPQRDEHEEGV